MVIKLHSNKSGVHRKNILFLINELLDIRHDHMSKKLLSKVGGEIDYIAYCPHAPESNVACCRKPEVGLLKK